MSSAPVMITSVFISMLQRTLRVRQTDGCRASFRTLNERVADERFRTDPPDGRRSLWRRSDRATLPPAGDPLAANAIVFSADPADESCSTTRSLRSPTLRGPRSRARHAERSLPDSPGWSHRRRARQGRAFGLRFAHR
jgi:hypothetical protein